MRRAAKRDANEEGIVDALRAIGCSVDYWGTNGAPDLVVGFNSLTLGRINLLLEVKDPAQPPSARQFTTAQKHWHAEWKGRAHLVETTDQALSLVKVYRGRMRQFA